METVHRPGAAARAAASRHSRPVFLVRAGMAAHPWIAGCGNSRVSLPPGSIEDRGLTLFSNALFIEGHDQIPTRHDCFDQRFVKVGFGFFQDFAFVQMA